MSGLRIESPDDLMAMALVLEQEAAARYHTLADRMQDDGQSELAALFLRLAVAEESHAERIHRRDGGRRGAALLAALRQQTIATDSPSGVYVDEAAISGRSTPYKALAAAVHSEEQAFALYSHIAANSEDPDLRRQAEHLALEELSHAALLRAQRRKAFHAERAEADPNRPAPPSPRAVDSMQALLDAAKPIETRILAYLGAAGMDQDGTEEAFQVTVEILRELFGEVAASVEPAVELESRQAFLDAIAESEQAFAFYDTVVTICDDEQILYASQALAARALDRLRCFYS